MVVCVISIHIPQRQSNDNDSVLLKANTSNDWSPKYLQKRILLLAHREKKKKSPLK